MTLGIYLLIGLVVMMVLEMSDHLVNGSRRDISCTIPITVLAMVFVWPAVVAAVIGVMVHNAFAK